MWPSREKGSFTQLVKGEEEEDTCDRHYFIPWDC